MARTLQEINDSILSLESSIAVGLGAIQDELIKKLADARVRELERDLADALNPYSSRMGALVKLENDVLFYRVNGMFVPADEIADALRKTGHPCMKEYDFEDGDTNVSSI